MIQEVWMPWMIRADSRESKICTWTECPEKCQNEMCFGVSELCFERGWQIVLWKGLQLVRGFGGFLGVIDILLNVITYPETMPFLNLLK